MQRGSVAVILPSYLKYYPDIFSKVASKSVACLIRHINPLRSQVGAQAEIQQISTI